MSRSWWQKIKAHPAGTVLIALLAVVIVLIILSILGYIFNWRWTGLSRKTLWDWLQLLIIPAVLAVGWFVINLTISRSEQDSIKQRDKTERAIALDRQHEATLKEYIDKISELLLHEHLRESKPDAEVRMVARIWTALALSRLDAIRKKHVVDFLTVTDLISDQYIFDLSGAILSEAKLSGVNLSGTVLSRVDLSKADLNEANLSRADLSEANLKGATGTTPEQLAKAKSLIGAIMPDGSVHS